MTDLCEFTWDGEGPIAYCEDWPMPGQPTFSLVGTTTAKKDEIHDAWEIYLRLENGAGLFMVCGYRTPGPKMYNLDGEPDRGTGDCTLWVDLPLPPEKADHPVYEYGNAAVAWLETSDGLIVEEGIPGDLTAIAYDVDCVGHGCEGCTHSSRHWLDRIVSAEHLRYVLARLSSVEVIARG